MDGEVSSFGLVQDTGYVQRVQRNEAIQEGRTNEFPDIFRSASRVVIQTTNGATFQPVTRVINQTTNGVVFQPQG
ncbi:hypothetical protein Hanom_Chr02g00108021 [Helianthus anomalus]